MFSFDNPAQGPPYDHSCRIGRWDQRHHLVFKDGLVTVGVTKQVKDEKKSRLNLHFACRGIINAVSGREQYE
jgi:hypothetical protein